MAITLDQRIHGLYGITPNKKLDIEIGALKYRDTESMKTLKKTFNYKPWKLKSDLIIDLNKIFV